MLFHYLKALHIIGMVTWFSGLFYMPRLLIYTAESQLLQPVDARLMQKQLLLMQRRLWYGITWPSAILTLLFGLGTWYQYGSTPAWLGIKLLFVGGLYLYHGMCEILLRQQQRGHFRYTSRQLRLWNEGATIFLVSIVFLVVLKERLPVAGGLLGLICLISGLYGGIKLYQRIRERK